MLPIFRAISTCGDIRQTTAKETSDTHGLVGSRRKGGQNRSLLLKVAYGIFCFESSLKPMLLLKFRRNLDATIFCMLKEFYHHKQWRGFVYALPEMRMSGRQGD